MTMKIIWLQFLNFICQATYKILLCTQYIFDYEWKCEICTENFLPVFLHKRILKCIFFLQGSWWFTFQKRRNINNYLKRRRTMVDSKKFFGTNGLNSRTIHHTGKWILFWQFKKERNIFWNKRESKYVSNFGDVL